MATTIWVLSDRDGDSPIFFERKADADHYLAEFRRLSDIMGRYGGESESSGWSV